MSAMDALSEYFENLPEILPDIDVSWIVLVNFSDDFYCQMRLLKHTGLAEWDYCVEIFGASLKFPKKYDSGVSKRFGYGAKVDAQQALDQTMQELQDDRFVRIFRDRLDNHEED